MTNQKLTKGDELPQDIKDFNEAFYKNKEAQLVAWQMVHPNLMPPIEQDTTGRLRWLNRDERRRRQQEWQREQKKKSKLILTLSASDLKALSLSKDS